MRPHMYPHQNNIRERRGGQPPMAPHLMGMPQQRPGVVMSLPNQSVQIMQNHHYTNQNSYSTQGQTNASSYMTQKQGPSQQSSYNQSNYSNPQVALTKQGINRTKSYRKECVKDSVNYNGNDPKSHNSFGMNEYSSGTLGNFNASSYNGQHYHPQQHLHRQSQLLQQQKLQQQKHKPTQQPQQQQRQEIVPENSAKNGDILSPMKENKENSREEASKISDNSQDCSQIKQNVLSSVKEKTPMCLVNELARFNKISHQYRLTNEQGPAHKKSFTVTLKLDSEEYTAEGSSIKKAQHLAAAEALSKTSFPHPAPKASKNLHPGKLNVTPTVELNALAMKRGEPAIYQLISAPQAPSSVPPHSSYYRRQYTIHRRWNKRGRLNYFFRNGRMPTEQILPEKSNFKVSLKVGVWEFFGEGPSPQTARHDAAAKALNHLKKLPVPEDGSTNSLKQSNVLASSSDQDFESNNKSPISLVHEIALKRNMLVQFEVISEKGPAHMKTFVTKCVVDDITVTGEGNAKKLSKKRAAECMLVELKKLPPISTSLTLSNAVIGRMKRKSNQAKKKSRNLIKIIQDRKSAPEYSEDINPISRLIQIQQLKKGKEPVYTLLEEKGMPRRREFVIEVTVGDFKAIGSGPNKKLAKKAAAQNLLNVLDYPNNEANPMKNALKSQDGSPDLSKDRKVTVVDSDRSSDNVGGSLGRQVKPGLYLIPSDLNEPYSDSSSTPTSLQTTAVIAKELLNDGNSPTADALVQKAATKKSAVLQPITLTVRPKEQLLYIANLLNFKVQFSDFPKGNHSEYLSLVSMSTDPSHVCHGSGPTIEDSQDQAALTALRALSEMGVDSMTPENPSME